MKKLDMVLLGIIISLPMFAGATVAPECTRVDTDNYACLYDGDNDVSRLGTHEPAVAKKAPENLIQSIDLASDSLNLDGELKAENENITLMRSTAAETNQAVVLQGRLQDKALSINSALDINGRTNGTGDTSTTDAKVNPFRTK